MDGRRSAGATPGPSRPHGFATIGLGLAGALLHGIASAAAPPPASTAQPLLHAFGWLAWAGAVRCSRGRSGAGEAGEARKETSRRASAGVALAGAIGVVALGQLLRWGAALRWGAGTQAPDPARTGAADAPLLAALDAWPLAVSAALFVLLPAIAEEAFFRGAALRALARHLRPPVAAGATSLLFAAAHPARPVEALCFGAGLAALCLATGRIREAVLAHAVHNALGLWILAGGAGTSAPPAIAWLAAGAIAALGLAALAPAVCRADAPLG